jgi:hypothetical protein
VSIRPAERALPPSEIATDIQPDEAHKTSLDVVVLGDQPGENDTYAFGLTAHPGQSQGRPAMSTGSQPKGANRGLPGLRSPSEPQRSGTSDATNAAGRNAPGQPHGFSSRYVNESWIEEICVRR